MPGIIVIQASNYNFLIHKIQSPASDTLVPTEGGDIRREAELRVTASAGSLNGIIKRDWSNIDKLGKEAWLVSMPCPITKTRFTKRQRSWSWNPPYVTGAGQLSDASYVRGGDTCTHTGRVDGECGSTGAEDCGDTVKNCQGCGTGTKDVNCNGTGGGSACSGANCTSGQKHASTTSNCNPAGCE